MNKSSLSLVVIVIFLLGLFVGNANLFADSRGYDDQEKIRRAQERLDQIDKYEQEQAKQRYDKNYGSSASTSTSSGDFSFIIVVILIFGFIYYMAHKWKGNEIKREIIITQEREEWLSKATALGFIIDDASKICPACAETIKLKAEICKHCKRSFSKNEVQEAINSALNTFFQNK